MKILRIRRGFTTNSSGANDWFSPKPPGGQNKGQNPGQNNAQGAGGNPENSQLAGMQIGETRVMMPNTPSSAVSSNVPFVSGLVIAVTGLFVFRKIYLKWQQKKALQKYNAEK